MDKKDTVSGGVNFLELLFLLFLGLKLGGWITWSWVWVFAPIWIPLAVIILIVLVAALGALLEAGIQKSKKAKENNK